MNTSNWIRVNLDSKAIAKTDLDRGVRLSVQASPHSIPKFVRGGYDPAIQRFVIEFRYLDSEAFVKEPADQNVTLRLGKNSHRLLGFELDLKRLGASKVRLEITSPQNLRERAIRELEQIVQCKQRGKGTATENYGLALMALEQKQNNLMSESELAAAI